MHLLSSVTTAANSIGGLPWLQDTQAAVDKCLNFKLQLNSRLDYSDGGAVEPHTVVKTVTSRLKLLFNPGSEILGGGGLFLA